MPTEKTPLTSSSPNFGSAPTVPFYVQDTYRFYSRRRRERQLQCIMFVTIVATFIMALIVTISYSVNHPDIIPPDSGNTSDSGGLDETPLVQQANQLRAYVQATGGGDGAAASVLSVDELRQAMAAGNAAIAARRAADSLAPTLPSPSANARHQLAVGTSRRADLLAFVAIAEIAATRKIEIARSFMGKPSSFGSFLDGGWAPEDVCARELKIQCPVYASKYRRIDGSCNHPRQLGMAFSPFLRTLQPDYADGIGAPRTGKFGNPLPSAREVSLKVHPPSPSAHPSFTVMLAVFGQFLDHDITATASSRGRNGSMISCCPPSDGTHPECFPVKIGPGDPIYDLEARSCMEFVRSAPAPQCKIGHREQLNQVTSFIDGSVIYGADLETVENLREFSGGRLRMQITPDKRELLPASSDPNDGCNRDFEGARGRYCFATGDFRANENLLLTTMHVLWARQHNRLAARLSEINPQWDDEKLFQESRRIVGAQLQHVTYREFLPIVLGESQMEKRKLKLLSSGFRRQNGTMDPSVANHFAAAAFRFAHTLLPGLMKMTDAEKGTSSYVQLHKMLFNPYSLYNTGGVESSITATTSNAIQKTSTHVSSQLTEHLFEDPMANQTKVPCGLDLVSLNIQRGRDHGLPGYAKWREYCGLKKPLNFDDLKDDMDPEALSAISKLYDNVDDVDLYTGALAEIPRGDGLVGPTFTHLLADQFERIPMSDKYWYELADQPGSFTEEQLSEIRKTSLARIICDTSDGITEIQAEVMRLVNPENPIVSCEDLPKVSLEAWKTEMPLLKASEMVVPAVDWLSFKNQVNGTLTDIISTIAAKKPPPGSLPSDWLAFQQEINATFSDLGSKFAALHPKVMTNVTSVKNLTSDPGVFDWMSVKNQVDSTVSDIIDSISANKPAPGSLPADWLSYKKKINDSLLDVKKKFKVVHPKVPTLKAVENDEKINAAPIIDWNQIKNEINSTIIDVIGSINASKPLPGSPPADWFAFRKKINDSLSGIKNKFVPVVRPIGKLKESSSGMTFDWAEFKNQLNTSLNGIINSTAAKQPPPGSSTADWLEFQKEINSTFSQFMNLFSDTQMNSSVNGDVENNTSATVDTNVFGDPKDVNKTINDIVAEINANRPPPGSTQEDWLAFREKLNNTFNSMQNKFVNVYPKAKNNTKKYPKVKLSATADDSTLDMVAFREDLNQSLTNLISIIKSKKPALDAPVADWATYKKEVKASVSKLKKEISKYTAKQLAESDAVEYAIGSDPLFDWMGWKSNINATIDGLLDEIKTIPPGDAKWAAFRSSLNNTFIDLKNRVASMKIKSPEFKLLAVMNEDFLNFKDKINSTIEDTLEDITNSKPAPGDPSWATYGISIKNRFAKIGEDVKSIKTEWLEKVKVATDMMIVAEPKLSMVSSSATSISLFQTKCTFCISFIIVTIVRFVH